MSKALVGKEDFLFLVNDFNGVQAQTSGEMVIESEDLEQIYQAHKDCRARAEKRGGSYIHIVAPNKETAYRRYLPEGYGYEIFGRTPVKQYFRAFPDAELITYLDTYALLPKPGFVTYDRGESHWTPQGALDYMNKAFLYFGRRREAELLSHTDCEMVEIEMLGDLARHAGLPPEKVVHARRRELPQVCHFEGDIVNDGYCRYYRCHEGKGRALILHDSFGQALFPFLSALYAETLFVHCPNFALDLEVAYAPDVLIKIQVERFFPYVPQTMASILPWIRDREAEKGASGKTSNFLAGFMSQGFAGLAAQG